MRTGFRRYIWWIAWRNLTAKARRAGLSFMTIVSILGVAIGVAALIIVLSVMGGFEQDLKDKMLRGMPHLEIVSKNAAAGFPLTKHPLAGIQQIFPEATGIEAYTQSDVVLKQKRHITSAILFGVDPARDGHLWGFGDAMTEGELDAIGQTHAPSGGAGDVQRPGIALGEQLAEQLGADLGDEITVLSPNASVTSSLSGGTVSRQFVVSGKFRTGLFNYDAKWAVVSLPEGRKFMPDYDESLDAEEYVTGVAMNFNDPFDIESYAQRIKEATAVPAPAEGKKPSPVGALSGLESLTWQQVNKSLLFALKLEKFAMGSILMLIVIVAGFSISGTMMMTVFHKRGQVSLLRSLGMDRGAIARLYLAHGFTIGTVGIALGLLFGLAVCALIKSFQFISLPAGVYHLKSLPCKWLWADYAIICTFAWLFSLLAATYPALTAARQDPGQGLRYL
jgi:lipoprotein-releasing system permease protein